MNHVKCVIGIQYQDICFWEMLGYHISGHEKCPFVGYPEGLFDIAADTAADSAGECQLTDLQRTLHRK